jgi:hypothetical protein
MKNNISLLIFSLIATYCSVISFAANNHEQTKLALGDHYAQFTDVRLHYLVAGKGPLVLVTSPGWGTGSIYLQNGLAPLEKDFTLLLLRAHPGCLMNSWQDKLFGSPLASNVAASTAV